MAGRRFEGIPRQLTAPCRQRNEDEQILGPPTGPEQWEQVQDDRTTGHLVDRGIRKRHRGRCAARHPSAGDGL